jgi:hypothetical protein
MVLENQLGKYFGGGNPVSSMVFVPDRLFLID